MFGVTTRSRTFITRRTACTIGGALALGALVGCGSVESTAAPCGSGAVRTCTGPDGCAGESRCSPDGSGFGECRCPGGTGGTGGTGNTDAVGGGAGSQGSAGAGGSMGTDSGAGGASGSGVDASADASPDAGPPCTAGLQRGPMMVDVGGWCIDSTEVTWGHYQEFLGAKGSDTSGQRSECATNDSYEPPAECVASLDPNSTPEHPVSCVDWCDAWAYCAWAEKRLCGRIGGGPSELYDPTDTPPTYDQWYWACSNGGVSITPYRILPGTDTRGLCVDTFYRNTGRGPEPVGSALLCHGAEPPFDAIYDLLGNVAEWTDNCSFSGTIGSCRQRGGYFESVALGFCYEPLVNQGHDPSMTHDGVGFRCCRG